MLIHATKALVALGEVFQRMTATIGLFTWIKTCEGWLIKASEGEYMRKLAQFTRFLSLVIVMFAIAGANCPPSPHSEREETAKTASNVHELSAGTVARRIDDVTYELQEAIASLKVGDVVFAKQLIGVPEGFAIKVEKIDSGRSNTTISGSKANLLDIFSELYVNKKNLVIMPPGEMRGSTPEEFHIPVSWSLSDDDGDALRFDGSVRFKIRLDILIDAVLLDLKEFDFKTKVDVAFDGNITHNSPLSFDINKLKVWESPPLGIINCGPLALVPTIKFNIKANGKLNVGSGINVTATLRSICGLQLKGGSWRAYGDTEPTFTVGNPVVYANAKGALTLLNPELSFKCLPVNAELYIGADLPEFQYELEAISQPRSVRFDLDAMFTAEVGMDANIFGEKFKWKSDPFVFRSMPIIDGEITNADGEIGVDIK
ncbi:MAG: hypothetical protein HONBIEJF_02363 [Fimbriimonadaceae bacterium]|nr:hypothetical protein [Fimbriimonadaceae bacterium]